ncbi:hypothetical protein ACHQM5_018786 [Ranunculus cassubicifolius]
MYAAEKSRSHISDDIVAYILVNLPVKLLCRLKCLSKFWHSFIEDPVFIKKIQTKSQPQWIRPPFHSMETDNHGREAHVYSIDDNGPATVLKTYLSPPGLLRQYSNLICSYGGSGSLQLTVFNTTTQESIVLSLPIIDSFRRNFEYGFEFDPVSKKHKVLTYKIRSYCYDTRCILCNPIGMQCERVRDFKILTLLEGENPAWRPIRNVPDIIDLSYWVVVADRRLFWFNDERPAQIISFNLATEKFSILKPPSKYVYFRRPLFEFEGSLCFVEDPNHGLKDTSSQLELKVWMLKDFDNINWVEVKKFSLCLDGTNLQKLF